ncbi:hypothetical protein A2U01_0064915, partial [Trifolium medium]|nr:hypothetical protein [Trifolium medium]
VADHDCIWFCSVIDADWRGANCSSRTFSFALYSGSFPVHHDISSQHVNSSADSLLPHDMHRLGAKAVISYDVQLFMEKWKSHSRYKL